MTQKRTYEELEERIQILEQEELTRNQVSEIWGDSMVLRSHFSQDEEIVCFEDLFKIEDIQRLQDDFSRATGVASIITHLDGTPITKPINFTRLCNDIIRKTEKGRANCYKSDAEIGRFAPGGPTIRPCLSGGMMDAGAAISVDGKHVANWLIGQVRNWDQSEDMIREYAKEIGADIEDTVEAFREIPAMSSKRFKQVAQVLFTLANQLSATAYQNVVSKRFIAQTKKSETERRRMEQDYRALFTEMMDSFALHHIICDEEGKPIDYRFIAVNPSFERMTGLKGDDIVGKTVLEVMPNTEQQWIETYGRVALTGKPAFFENYSIELDKHFAVTAYQPNANYFACIFRDITDRKHVEEERAKFTADLAAKNDELEQLVYVVSHDLRSPLVNIDGYSRELDFSIKDLQHTLSTISTKQLPTAMAPFLEEDIPESLRFIRTSAAKMDSLLSGLLHLSRSGRAEVVIEPLDMNNLIGSVIDTTKFQIQEVGATVEIGNLPECQGDVAQVNQVFSNLIGNALKYLNPQRVGIIKISGKVEENRSVYCVEDNGIGIDQAHMEKIFEIFHQLDPRNSQGDGLGLAIVKRILNRLNGAAWSESTIDIGSRFFVALPTDQLKNN